MATSSTTPWAAGFSENPGGEPLSAKSIIEMLDRIGDELVAPPGSQGGSGHDSGRPMTRRELLARVLWTRAIVDADGAPLAAPPGQHDDRAMACVLALAALRTAGTVGRGVSAIIPSRPLWPGDRGSADWDELWKMPAGAL